MVTPAASAHSQASRWLAIAGGLGGRMEEAEPVQQHGQRHGGEQEGERLGEQIEGRADVVEMGGTDQHGREHGQQRHEPCGASRGLAERAGDADEQERGVDHRGHRRILADTPSPAQRPTRFAASAPGYGPPMTDDPDVTDESVAERSVHEEPEVGER